jgi:SpoVK/Ycf46/Vps4 family AAA+-type ATPase
LKTWLQKRSLAYSKAAKVYGLPSPKGVLLVGVPGTGKSLTAKAVGNHLGMPLLRLDVGRLYGSYVGETEGRLRHALDIIESVAPDVLWIDEVEKAFAGATGPSGDSGVSQRVFGSVLTWLQDKQAPAFVVATANNVRSLPPEFLRRGRFDEIFFIDLPTASERRAILDVLLRKYGRDSKVLVNDELVSRLERFTGAEIEQVIIEALYNSFYDSQRALRPADIKEAASNVVPIADQMRTEIDELRRWGHSQARMASSEKEEI